MADPKPCIVLIADDNAQNVELLEAYLAELHCEVLTAFDGQETLRRINESKPDVVLLDVMMPKVSGFEVCKQIKSRPETRDVQVLMVTSLHETADIDRGVAAGADDFLSKPVNKQILLKRVQSLLKVRQLQGELKRTLAYIEEVEAEDRKR